MNFGTISSFMARNGKSILKKTALAAGVIAGLAFLTDTPTDEFADDESILTVPTGDGCVEGEVESTAVDVTEEAK